MKKYRFKTKEEFLNDGLWIHDPYSQHDDGYPDHWSESGDMNKYLGQEIPTRFNGHIEKGHEFEMHTWTGQFTSKRSIRIGVVVFR